MRDLLTAADLDAADEAIWAEVRNAFAEALGLDDDEVELNGRIIDELGAESLDFLDIAFRLERSFDIRIPRGGIESAARGDVNAEAYEQDGVLTDLARQRLAEAMPEVSPDEFSVGMRTTDVPELFRVATFYNLVVRLLNERDVAVDSVGMAV